MSLAKKAKSKQTSAKKQTRQFESDAFEFKDEVTAEAVDSLRKKATKQLDDQKWERIDGFGRIFRT